NPSIKLTLLDSKSKKIHYLNELCKKYNLNIKCVNSRGEEYSKTHKEQYDFVIARAVTQLNILMEISTPLIKVGGCLIAMKGLNYEQEINLSKKAFKELNCSIECIYEDTLPSNNDKRAIIYIKKNGSTKLKYPRDYSTIKRKPL
ncbi:MAG: class I SAM-dependent methyltransferase, partial [Bacilli bacterium]|nr:class I SAM-dependent methyltransferase [Bacilli bacterium]